MQQKIILLLFSLSLLRWETNAQLKETAREKYWEETTEPFQLTGPLYYVGTLGLGSFLITTETGHILLCTGLPSSGPQIEQSIRTLGFRPEDIKILLTSNARIDQSGALAYFKKKSNANMVIMDKDQPALESGGRDDDQYGNNPDYQFEPVLADQVLKDQDTVRLGKIMLIAHLTPGQTRGSTTWEIILPARPKPTRIIVVAPMGNAENYKSSFDKLKKLKAGIWLSPHTDFCNFELKRKRFKQYGIAAFHDPSGYLKKIAEEEKKFQ